MSDRPRHVKAPSGSSLLEHRLDGGAVVRASETASYQIEERTVGVTARVTVDRGLVWATVPDAVAAPTVEVRVGTAVVRARPAQVGLEVTAAGDALLEVVEGSVSVLPQGDGPIQLGANEAAHLSAAGAVTETLTVSAEELGRDPWVADNLALDGRRAGDPRRTARFALLAVAVLLVAAVAAIVIRAADDESVRSRPEPVTSSTASSTEEENTAPSTEDEGRETTERERRTTTTERERQTTTTRRRATTDPSEPRPPDGDGASQTTRPGGGLRSGPLSTFAQSPMPTGTPD